MSLPWRPRFVYGATTLNLLLPMRPPLPLEGSFGGVDWSAASVPSGYTIHEFSDLQVRLRFTEAEWPSVRSMIRACQDGASFTFRPDQSVVTSYTCYLVSPVAGEDIRPLRGDDPGTYELTIVLRTATGAFDVRYFADA